MDWFRKRVSEPSSWAGVAAMVFGGGALLKVDEAPAVAQAVGEIGTAVAGGTPWYIAAPVAIAGALAAILGEKGRR